MQQDPQVEQNMGVLIMWHAEQPFGYQGTLSCFKSIDLKVEEPSLSHT